MSKIITVTLTTSIYDTLEEYIKDYRTPAFPNELKSKQEKESTEEFNWRAYASEFCKWKELYSDSTTYQDNKEEDEKSFTNLDYIRDAFKNYPQKLEEIDILIKKGDYLNLPLKPGIKFSIPLEKISREALLTHGVEVASNNEPAFKAQALIDLESDLGYKKVFKQNEENTTKGSLKYEYPDITVWIWCRTLSDNSSTEDHELKGQIFNVTPFITNINTSHTKNGGNFSISLMPVIAQRDSTTGKWVLKERSSIVNKNTGEVIFTSNLHDVENIDGESRLVRDQILFHNMISPNDLVFIRYETLKMEEEQRLKDDSDFVIDKRNLGGRIYDLIGLVDRNILTTNFEANVAQVNVSGRDLSKLFIEDGSYFYSMEMKEGVFHVHGGASKKNDMMQRVVNTNAYLYLGLYYNNSIEDILKFVIQQLTTIKVVPDDLFESYNEGAISDNDKLNKTPAELKSHIDRRNKKINDSVFDTEITRGELKSSISKNREKLIERKQNIIDKITKFRVKEFSANRNISTQDIKNSSEKVFQDFVEFIQNTIDNRTEEGEQIAKLSSLSSSLKFTGWRSHTYKGELVLEDTFPNSFNTDASDLKLFYNFVDYPSLPIAFDSSYIHQDIYNYILENKSLKSKDLANDVEELSPGIWQIVKLVIDDKVAKRLLIDSSVSSASGSLINFLKKVAQEPFVELLMDTYKDCFYIIVRQPPTDRVSMMSYLTGNYLSEKNINESDNNLNKPAIVDIEEIDVASTDLMFDDSQVYSWYHFVPQASFIGGSQQFSTSYIPAIYFPEYSEIWGSKSLDLVHNYINYYLRYKEDSTNRSFSDLQKQTFYDMKYLVESNQYMPFTRKGTILVKGGDRRIKIGNLVRLKSTGEIFMVDSVTNTYSIGSNIERTTTVQVSRGLNETFIWGVKGSVLNEMFKGRGYSFTNDKRFSYFDIINTELNFSKKKKIKKYKTVEEKVPIGNGGERSEGSVEDLSKPLKDAKNEAILKKLNKKAIPVFRAFLNKLDQLGWQVIITSGKRTYVKQKALWEKDKNAAKPGTSKHETGLAIDINVIARRDIGKIKKGTQLMLGGKHESGRKKMKPLWLESGIPQMAIKQFGMIWGGNYSNYSDNIHFQLTDKSFLSSAEEIIEERVVTKQVEDGEVEVVDEEAVFSNFKVDKEIFNFFLRKQQMGIILNNNNKTTGNVEMYGVIRSDGSIRYD